MPGDLRTLQVARMLGLGATPTDVEAREAIATDPDAFAGALFREAADNDDVTSAEAALDYLETRLSFFGDLIPPEARLAIRAAFANRLTSWG